MYVSMLEERDKLMEKLRECQESYSESTKKLCLVEADNGVLMRQLQALMPDVRPLLSGTMPLPADTLPIFFGCSNLIIEGACSICFEVSFTTVG